MIVGVVILQALGNNPPSAGAFCLSRYTRTVPVEEAVLSRVNQDDVPWDSIEIYYSGTQSGNIQQVAFLCGLANPDDVNCHFVICNGLGAGDGQIQPTERWQIQEPVNRNWLNHEPQAHSGGQTIFICVIADYENARPTDLQIKTTKALVKALCRKFDIKSESIHTPGDWR
jgi:hypothetical protein